VPAGDHRVELVGKNLYGSQSVKISTDSTTQLQTRVFPAGQLQIKVPEAARLTIKGSDYSAAIAGGSRLLSLPAGEYDIKADGDDCIPTAAKLSVKEGGTATWDPYSIGNLVFDVSPAGVLCLIQGGKEVPTDKDVVGLAPGDYKATLRKKGYREEKVSFSITAGKRSLIKMNLIELASGSVSLPKLGCAIALRVDGDLIYGKESPDGSVEYAGIPSGCPLDISFYTPLNPASDIDLPAQRIRLEEGEKIKLTIPSGRFSLPWFPVGAIVELGIDGNRVLDNEGSQGFLSPLLPPGKYRVVIEGELLQKALDLVAIISPDGQSEPAGYREAMTASLASAKEKEAKALVSRRTKTKIGFISLGAGLLGAAGAATTYALERQAMDAYQSAPSSSRAAELWKNVELLRTIFYATLGVGGVGLGLSPVFMIGTPPSSLEKSIQALDEGIKALAK